MTTAQQRQKAIKFTSITIIIIIPMLLLFFFCIAAFSALLPP